MKQDALSTKVTSALFDAFAKAGMEKFAKVYGVPSHVHLCKKDREVLFGTSVADSLEVVGPRGSITLEVSANDYGKTRVDISFTDGTKIGLKGLRTFSETRDGIGCELKGPKGQIMLENGVAAPQRHLHISSEDAKVYDFTDGQKITAVVAGTTRTTQFEHVLVRVGNEGPPLLHLDEDEARAAAITDGQCATLIRGEDTNMTREEVRIIVEETVRHLLEQYIPGCAHCSMTQPTANTLAANAPAANAQKSTAVDGLLLEDDVKDFHDQGFTTLLVKTGCIVTPLAKDKASEYSIELCYEEE